jgi:hypothetical protein
MTAAVAATAKNREAQIINRLIRFAIMCTFVSAQFAFPARLGRNADYLPVYSGFSLILWGDLSSMG